MMRATIRFKQKMNPIYKMVRRKMARKVIIELCELHTQVEIDHVIQLVYEYLLQQEHLVKYRTKKYDYLAQFFYVRQCVDDSLDHQNNDWMLHFLKKIIQSNDLFDCGLYVYLVELLAYYFKERSNVQHTKK